MIIVLCGPSGSGKTTIANMLIQNTNASIFTGKDYLRLAKNKDDAWKLFSNMLETEYNQTKNAIYIITETEDLDKIRKISGIKLIKIIANKDVLLERFVKRMNGKTNPAFKKMIEVQSAKWNNEKCELEFDTSNNETEQIVIKIKEICNNIL